MTHSGVPKNGIRAYGGKLEELDEPGICKLPFKKAVMSFTCLLRWLLIFDYKKCKLHLHFLLLSSCTSVCIGNRAKQPHQMTANTNSPWLLFL